jgi:hypothetical protein
MEDFSIRMEQNFPLLGERVRVRGDDLTGVTPHPSPRPEGEGVGCYCPIMRGAPEYHNRESNAGRSV